jgi:hypothetical protein
MQTIMHQKNSQIFVELSSVQKYQNCINKVLDAEAITKFSFSLIISAVPMSFAVF